MDSKDQKSSRDFSTQNQIESSSMIHLNAQQYRIFRRIQRKKYNVSITFLKSNMPNILKFLCYALTPRSVIKRRTIRKSPNQRIIIDYNYLRRVLFDTEQLLWIKKRRRNVKQWSKRMARYLRSVNGIKEHVEVVYKRNKPEEISRKIRDQLVLLKSDKRIMPLFTKIGENMDRISESVTVPTAVSATSILENNEVITNQEMDKTDEEIQKYLNNTISNYNNDVQSKIGTQNDADGIRDVIRTTATSAKNANQQDIVEEKQFKDNSVVPLKEQIKLMNEKTTDIDKQQSKRNDEVESITKPKEKFLDMLYNKVRVKNIATMMASPPTIQREELSVDLPSTSQALKSVFRACLPKTNHENADTDSSEDFLGFEDGDRLPNMLLTPTATESKVSSNSAFVSEKLNEYMRKNSLESNYKVIKNNALTVRKFLQAKSSGLVAPGCIAPHMDMPLVPESLLKLRTVAERRNYLQKCSKSHKMAIINNEATLYRELQRKKRQHKTKCVAQQNTQSSNSTMPYTRNGWQAASFVTTESNKYFYQKLDVDNGRELVKLPGVRGNNDELNKKPYLSFVPASKLKNRNRCNKYCIDLLNSRNFKPTKMIMRKKKLNTSKTTQLSGLKPCPLSFKPQQQALDDETAALLLAGGSMAVVRMPTVELQVFPELGKPLHEIAKRYLQYILPHYDISREWAEFSVSTLQQPHTIKEVEEHAVKEMASKGRRKSFTFAIPYLNDRNHILVRRVVDRSEKLDESFEMANGTDVKDFKFRVNIDTNDSLLNECADILSDMINCVAISCSENSFIRDDPDNIYAKTNLKSSCVNKINAIKETTSVNGNKIDPKLSLSQTGPQIKKQNRLLMELRRLNATIIDTATIVEKDTGPCNKKYCSFGCVCSSIMDDHLERQHCGKAKCIFECNCKSTNQSRFVRVENDGRSITTEDAFALRRKATARLARMEKEFTSTIVLTENEALLINESQIDKKRRCTKAPKRYEDFADTDEDFARTISPIKTNNTNEITDNSLIANGNSVQNTNLNNSNNSVIEILGEPKELIYVANEILDQMKHCTVSLVRFSDIKNMATWCMIHELYKCFCRGQAIDGKPMVIENQLSLKNQIVASSLQQQQQTKVNYKPNFAIDPKSSVPATPKAQYSFEKIDTKIDTEEELVDSDDRDSSWDKDSGDEYEPPAYYIDKTQKYKKKVHSVNLKKGEKREKSGKIEKFEKGVKDYQIEKGEQNTTIDIATSEEYIVQRFLSPHNTCRRSLAVPKNYYLKRNRKRVEDEWEFIRRTENAETVKNMHNKVVRNLYYHKYSLRKLRKKRMEQQEKRECENHTCENDADKNLNSIELEFDKYFDTEFNNLPSIRHDTADELLSTDGTTDDNKTHNTTSSLICQQNQNCIPIKNIGQIKRGSILWNFMCEDGSNILENQEQDQPPKKRYKIELIKKDNKQQVGIISDDENISEPAANCYDNTKSARVNRITDDNQIVSSLSDLSLKLKSPLSIPQIGYSTSSNCGIKVPKITSCYSLNKAAAKDNTDVNCTEGEKSAASDILSSTNKSTQAEFTYLQDATSIVNEGFKEFYNNVIKNMNSLVSSKMQHIDSAIKRESKVIPPPNDEILCMIRWYNFLEAFNENYVYIWQVKTTHSTEFLVATINKVMPMVPGAVSVINITFIELNKLMLMGRWLRMSYQNYLAGNVAVVMQGREKFWLIKGFLLLDGQNACCKPTPTTHPILTRKINILCTSLCRQRVKDHQKKLNGKNNIIQKKRSQNQVTTEPQKVELYKKLQQQNQTLMKTNKELATNVHTIKINTGIPKQLSEGIEMGNQQNNSQTVKIQPPKLHQIEKQQQLKVHQSCLASKQNLLMQVAHPQQQKLIQIQSKQKQQKQIPNQQHLQKIQFKQLSSANSKQPNHLNIPQTLTSTQSSLLYSKNMSGGLANKDIKQIKSLPLKQPIPVAVMQLKKTLMPDAVAAATAAAAVKQKVTKQQQISKMVKNNVSNNSSNNPNATVDKSNIHNDNSVQKNICNLNNNINDNLDNTDIEESKVSSIIKANNNTDNTINDFSTMQTNIEFRAITNEDVLEIQQPERPTNDHRWLVLNLFIDFSHIFVPEFRDLISLDRIHKVMTFARAKNKIVKLQFFLNAPFDAFVTPSSTRKIYFGPLEINKPPPLLILLQCVDNLMVLREIYQQDHDILPTNERTTAFWMTQVNGELHFPLDESSNNDEQQSLNLEVMPKLIPIKRKVETTKSTEKKNTTEHLLNESADEMEIERENINPSTEEDDSDDDCLIIEDETVKNIPLPIPIPLPMEQEYESNDEDDNNYDYDDHDDVEDDIDDNLDIDENKINHDEKKEQLNQSQRFLIDSPELKIKSNLFKQCNKQAIESNLTTVTDLHTEIGQNTDNVMQIDLNTLKTNSGFIIDSSNMKISKTTPAIASQFVPITLPVVSSTATLTSELSKPDVMLSVLSLPNNAVITNIAEAPKDAPYCSTIYISNKNNASYVENKNKANGKNVNGLTLTEIPNTTHFNDQIKATKNAIISSSFLTPNVSINSQTTNDDTEKGKEIHIPTKRRRMTVSEIITTNRPKNEKNSHLLLPSIITTNSSTATTSSICCTTITKLLDMQTTKNVSNDEITKTTDSSMTSNPIATVQISCIDSSAVEIVSNDNINDEPLSITNIIRSPTITSTSAAKSHLELVETATATTSVTTNHTVSRFFDNLSKNTTVLRVSKPSKNLSKTSNDNLESGTSNLISHEPMLKLRKSLPQPLNKNSPILTIRKRVSMSSGVKPKPSVSGIKRILQCDSLPENRTKLFISPSGTSFIRAAAATTTAETEENSISLLKTTQNCAKSQIYNLATISQQQQQQQQYSKTIKCSAKIRSNERNSGNGIIGNPQNSKLCSKILNNTEPNNSNVVQPNTYSQLGYFTSKNKTDLPKFLAKRLGGDYLLKIPGVGVLRLNGTENVNKYLNRYFKLKDDKFDKNTVWKFIFAPRFAKFAEQKNLKANNVEKQKMWNVQKTLATLRPLLPKPTEETIITTTKTATAAAAAATTTTTTTNKKAG